MKRREFSKPIKVEILTRCKVPTGFRCEACGAVVATGHIDHIDPDALQVDKSEKLTADDGQFLCLPCHSIKTKDDVKHISKAKRIEAKHLGASKPKGTIKSRVFERKHRTPKPSLPPRELYNDT
jgi:hypothetical protein